MMPGRRWSDGLHQAVEAKEGVKVQSESVTYATITIQNYFRMYQKLAGMSGTAVTEAEEFDKIYSLGVVAIPTNLEYQAMQPESYLEEIETRDEQGYRYQYYARKEDESKEPIFWRRKDFPDVVYRSVEAKLRSICREILQNHALGRPMLVGTTSVENSETLSNRLRAEPLKRLAQVTLLRDSWITQHNYVEDGRQISELQFLNQPLEVLDTGQMRNLARDLNIPFIPEDPVNLDHLLEILRLPKSASDRLLTDLQAGIPHQVLNARKHTEESQIIASAGSFGSVTIATNMAGRGVDIKLGGEMAEEIIASVNRVLNRAGYDNAYEMTHLERKEALLNLDPVEYGIYDSEINYFFKYLEEMELVRELGGLHVIGSERHEARRIDNQLRGRSARQGDPGSSRFFLSMEDDLMRLFGGQQADSMMQRLKIDDALPLEMGLVSRLIEQSQTRVEGANFDVRKHLLEYDDVLNAQRARIYAERNRVFTKSDLTEDVTTMLNTELQQRIPVALKDEGGPWKLIAWLDQIQPSLSLSGRIFPSFSLNLLTEEVRNQLAEKPTKNDLRNAILGIVRASLQAEAEHHLQSISTILDQALDRMEAQIQERQEALDLFFDGLEFEDEDGARRKSAELLAELSQAARIPLKLSNDQQRILRDDPSALSKEIIEQVIANIRSQTVARLLGTIEMRIGESLEIQFDQLDPEYWSGMTNDILSAIEQAMHNREERLIGDNGQITKDLDNMLANIPMQDLDDEIHRILLQIPQGSRAMFDRRTHRRTIQRTIRLTYVYYAARFLDELNPEVVADEVLDHLESAQNRLCQAWGEMEFNRLSNSTLADLEEQTRNEIMELLEIVEGSPHLTLTLASLDADQHEILVDALGRRILSNIYRQLLLGVITELWVDYLTQMEALRVSIGLEAYAQRDPLVQYKSRASELFQGLQSNIRLGVVSRMFTYQPRDINQVQTRLGQSEDEADIGNLALEETIKDDMVPQLEGTGENPSKNQKPSEPQSGGKRRRRRRK
jgi:preprotein translocase subunit SecA